MQVLLNSHHLTSKIAPPHYEPNLDSDPCNLVITSYFWNVQFYSTCLILMWHHLGHGSPFSVHHLPTGLPITGPERQPLAWAGLPWFFVCLSVLHLRNWKSHIGVHMHSIWRWLLLSPSRHLCLLDSSHHWIAKSHFFYSINFLAKFTVN